MAKKKKISAIGLSMLDLISNSLAAVIILFIIISSLRLPYIPPERIEGTLFVRYELLEVGKSKSSSSKIWIEPPVALNFNDFSSSKRKRYWEEDIYDNNNSLSFCGERAKIIKGNTYFNIPCATIYSPIDSSNVHYLIIRYPREGKWISGIQYSDDKNMTMGRQEREVKVNAWFDGPEIKNWKLGITKETGLRKLVAPTDTLGFAFETPDLKNLK